MSFAAFMAYAEGYKGFQTKFCPLVVARSAGLARSREPGVAGAAAWVAKVALAPVQGGPGKKNDQERVT